MKDAEASHTSWSDVSRKVFAYFFALVVGGVAVATVSKASSTGLRRGVEGSLLASKPRVLFGSGLSTGGSGKEDEDLSAFRSESHEYFTDDPSKMYIRK
jgi:hypothetical protein